MENHMNITIFNGKTHYDSAYSFWTWAFTLSFPIRNGLFLFQSYVKLPQGNEGMIPKHQNIIMESSWKNQQQNHEQKPEIPEFDGENR